MWKVHSVRLALGIGLAAILASACNGGDGEGGALCVTDADCPQGDICHPELDECVQTCTLAADCPDEAKNCEALVRPDGTTGPNICKCVTDELCAGGDTVGSSRICSDVFEICVTRCDAGRDCPTGYTCDTVSGECQAAMGQTCTWGTCAAGLNCNLSTGVCATAEACTVGGVEPGVCDYGQYCAVSGVCDFVPKPTCPNIAQATGVDWNPRTDMGPVIFDVDKERFITDTTFCTATAPKRVTVEVQAYRPQGIFTTQQDLLNELRYFQVSGNVGPDPGVTDLVVSNNGQNATFDLNFCVPADFTQFTGAIQFTGGNPLCFVVEE